MSRKRRITLLTLAILLLLALILPPMLGPGRQLARCADQLTTYLAEAEAEARAFHEHPAVQTLIDAGGSLQAAASAELLDLLEQQQRPNFHYCLYRETELRFWSSQLVLPDEGQVADWKDRSESNWVDSLSNGYYLVLSHTLPAGAELRAYSLIPLYFRFQLEEQFPAQQFPAAAGVSGEVGFSLAPTGYPVHTAAGTTACYLFTLTGGATPAQQTLLLFLYLLICIALGYLLNDLAIQFSRRYGPWTGALFLLCTVGVIRYLSIYLDLTGTFYGLPIFSRTFSTPVLNYSLGDLLINIVLLLWFMIFVHREFAILQFPRMRLWVRLALSTTNYLAILMSILVIIGAFRNLVLNSGITFDFDNVFNLNIYSKLAIVGMILLLLAFFLFSHRMMLTIMSIGLNAYGRIIAFVLAFLLAIPFFELVDLQLPLINFFLGGLALVLLFDLFVESENPNLTWLLGWLLIFAGFSSVLLFKYHSDKDRALRLSYARSLVEPVDPVAEEILRQLNADWAAADPAQPKADWWQQRIDESAYLSNHYRLLVEPADTAALAETGRWLPQKNEQVYLRYRRPADTRTPFELNLEREDRPRSQWYSGLLKRPPFRLLDQLPEYEYAIYRNGLKVESSYRSPFPETLQPQEWPAPEESGDWRPNSERSDLIYRGGEQDLIVLIGRDIGGYLKPISLFSYLFFILVLAVPVLLLLNYWLRALPNTLDFTVARRPSLSHRIQLWVIGLTLLSFVLIGFFTVLYFRQTSNYAQEVRIREKIETIQEDLHRELQRTDGRQELDALLAPLFQVHRTDMYLYDSLGRWIASTEEAIFRQGVLAPRMDPYAYLLLGERGETLCVRDEQIGDLRYKSAYLPISLPQERARGFVGFPFYAGEHMLRAEVTDFIGALLNVYVFLLLIAGVVAISVASSITQPIRNLMYRLREVKLGKNEPLEWKRKDEIGTLIAEYNLMLEKLEESTALLAQSERESAWRQMAKQVAHEIKNPLTPMKLSIQHLQLLLRSNPDQLEERIERVAKTMVEQIDALSRIASEFSAFAKMPQPKNSLFELTALMRSVHELFVNERPEMSFELFLPPGEIFVFADKDHLMRVLNNLYKNAIQAVPDDRRGRIEGRIESLPDRQVRISVSDNGSGIPEDMRELVFVPNFTTKSSGTGIGLAIAKSIIEAARGRLYFETEVDQGTTFFIDLPMAEEAQSETEE